MILHQRTIKAAVFSGMTPRQMDLVLISEWQLADQMGRKQAGDMLVHADCGCCHNMTVGAWQKQPNGDYVCTVSLSPPKTHY